MPDAQDEAPSLQERMRDLQRNEAIKTQQAAASPSYQEILLERAAEEIRRLRQTVEIMAGQLRVLDIFDRALTRREGGGIAGSDLVYELEKQRALLKAERELRNRSKSCPSSKD